MFYLNYTDHGVNYDIYSIGNNIDIFDADGSFLTRVTFSNSFVYDEKMFAKTQLDPINLFGIRASGLADQYNVFDTIGPVAGTTFTFNEHSLTYTLVMSALVAYCSQNYLYILEQVLDEITLQICSGQMAVVNVTFYYGYNKYCNILRLEAGSANSVRTNDYHYWTANPWDYATVDTPSRLLTEIYAY